MQLATDDDGNNLFHALAALGDAREATKILSSTPKKVVSSGLVARNKAGMTPLHIAALAGKLKVLNAYLDAAPEDTDNIKCAQGYLFRDRLSRKINHGERYYQIQRFMRLDKLGLQEQQFDTGNVDAFKVAASNSSLIMFWESISRIDSLDLSADGFEFPRSLFTVIKGVTCELDLGDSNPISAATSNNHSIVLAADGRVYTWGKNVNGILGLDIEDKIVTQPTQVWGSFMTSASTSAHINKFSALSSGLNNGTSSSGNGLSVKGITCSDFFSACHTSNKVWVWGANRGQMMNKEAKNAIAEEPLLVYESPVAIRKIAASDSALVLLLENNQVAILKNDRFANLAVGKSKHGSEILDLRARGDYLAVFTSDYRVLRFNLGGTNTTEHGDTIWSVRNDLDTPTAFDVSESGIFVIATKRGVYRVEEKGNVTELRQFRGAHVRDVVFNLHGYTAIATLGVNVIPRPATEYSVMWSLSDSEREDICLEFDTEGDKRKVIKTHRAILYARCPTLRPLLTSDAPSKAVIGVPGGSVVFKFASHDTIKVNHAPEKSIEAFLKALYLSTDKTSRERLKNLSSGLALGPEMFEFSALQRLMTHSLASGLWEARQSQIACDTLLHDGKNVHSAVLSAASPVLAANLKRRENNEASTFEFGLESSATIEDVVVYIYTGEINADIDLLDPVEQAERVFSLWIAADVLMIPSLIANCEDRLVEMMNYELLVPFLEIALTLCKHDNQRLLTMLLGCAIECIGFILSALKEMPNDQVTRIESALAAISICDKDAERMLSEVSVKFNSLKSQSQLRSASASTTKSKGRKLSSTLDRAEVSTLRATISTKEASVDSSKTCNVSSIPAAVKSPSIPWNRAQSPISPPASAETVSSFVGGEWIQAGKKPRAGSSSIERTKINDQIASLGSTRASPSARSVSPINPPRSSPSSSSSSLATPTRTLVASSPITPSPLASLPKLGSSLPKLGSTLPKLGGNSGANKQPNPKKSSKATFKGSKNLSVYETAAQLERDSDPAPSATPWKPIPVVQTKSVLERLEKASKSRKPGSVWSS